MLFIWLIYIIDCYFILLRLGPDIFFPYFFMLSCCPWGYTNFALINLSNIFFRTTTCSYTKEDGVLCHSDERQQIYLIYGIEPHLQYGAVLSSFDIIVSLFICRTRCPGYTLLPFSTLSNYQRDRPLLYSFHSGTLLTIQMYKENLDYLFILSAFIISTLCFLWLNVVSVLLVKKGDILLFCNLWSRFRRCTVCIEEVTKRFEWSTFWLEPESS